jgi:DNA-binding CsgD family transcriptional regulator
MNSGAILLGRDHEREAIDALLRCASAGMSGVLVIHGEAGMGKTALLGYAVNSSPSLPLARISGVEAEREFGFAGLHRLLLPFLDHVEELPGPQRDALRSAFGLSELSPADPFLVGLATLTLLADRASTTGMLCIIDDIQWIDSASLQAIAFVGRRLGAEGIVLLLGFRSSADLPVNLAGLPTMEIDGLPSAAAAQLLAEVVPGPLDPRVTTRIITETNGCPLALIDLASDLTGGQLVGADPLAVPIPISRRLEDHYRRRVAAFPADTQTFLLVASADTSGDPALIRRAASALGCDPDAEVAAVREHLLTMEPTTQFRHPLIRSAVYAGADAQEKRRVHGTLASLIDPSTDPDRRAQHLAATTTGADAVLAAELEASAGRARDRGGYAAEAELLAQAAEFSQPGPNRSRRFLVASVAAVKAGAPERAAVLLAEARVDLVEPLMLAESQRIEGLFRMLQAHLIEVPALHLAAARQFLPVDKSRARQSLLEAFDAFLLAQQFSKGTDGVEIAKVALETSPSGGDSTLKDLLLDGTSLLVAVGYQEAVATLQRAAQVLRDGPNSTDDFAKWFNYGLIIANELWDDRTYLAWLEKAEASARKLGALNALQVVLLGMANHELRAGRFSSAEGHFAESLEVATAIGGLAGLFEPMNVTLLAWRGDETGTRTAARMLIEGGAAVGMAVVQFQSYHALAILELGAGRYKAALDAAEQINNRDAIGWSCQTLALAVEAGSRSGDREAAEQALAKLTVRAEASRTPWGLGLLARSRGLMADGDSAGRHFEEAIGLLQQTLVRTDLLTTHLVYGEWLRRRKRGVDAQVHLRKAFEEFTAMGAQGFAERARTELLASGTRTQRRAIDTANDLTPQEARVARLASEGATNPEIAAQLFVSAHTVDYHLRKVYRKLGVESRRELSRALKV